MIQKYLEQYNEKLKISTKFSNITKSALIELQNRRLKTVKLKDGFKGYAAQWYNEAPMRSLRQIHAKPFLGVFTKSTGYQRVALK